MKIATFNVNGINGRLPMLLRWLEEARPDVVCLQELKRLVAADVDRDVPRLGKGEPPRPGLDRAIRGRPVRAAPAIGFIGRAAGMMIHSMYGGS